MSKKNKEKDTKIIEDEILTGNQLSMFFDKPNVLVDLKGSLTSFEMDIFDYLLTMIDISDTDLRLYNLNIADFCSATNRDKRATITYLKVAISSLRSKECVFRDNTRNSTIVCSLISGAEVFDDGSSFNIELSNLLKPYLFEYKASMGYTRLSFGIKVSLSSIYSKRMYELFKKWLFARNEHTFTIDELKDCLEIDRTQYDRFNNFKIRIIDTFCNEINSVDALTNQPITDIIVEYTLNYVGKKVVSITFRFKHNELFSKHRLNYLHYDPYIVDLVSTSVFMSDNKYIDLFTSAEIDELFTKTKNILSRATFSVDDKSRLVKVNVSDETVIKEMISLFSKIKNGIDTNLIKSPFDYWMSCFNK